MKTDPFRGIFFLLVFFGLPFSAVAQLLVGCEVFYDNKPLRGYSLVISADGERTDSVFVKQSKTGDIKLQPDKMYALRFIKKGYAEKIILVDTRLPEKVKAEEVPLFEFEIALSTWTGKINNPYRDFPAALLAISKRKKEFTYSKNYSEFITASNQ